MKLKYPINDNMLIKDLKHQYHLHIIGIEFIPMGDSAYSYVVTCTNGEKYYLKLFDHDNDRQLDSLRKLYRVLPLLWRLYSQGIMTNIAFPIKNANQLFKTVLKNYSIVLFNYIDGETLADAYPFSNTILETLGKAIATIHQTNMEYSPLLKEDFDLSFEENLMKCISILGEELTYTELEIVLRKKEQIVKIIENLHELRSIILQSNFGFCHGDLWGGNLIQQESNIYIIDWESAMLAPPEYDLFTYIGDGFDILLSSYRKNMSRPVEIDLDLMRFYSYRHHLRNLTNWLMNILFRNKEAVQNLNDIEMIQHHCLNRLDSVEANIKKVEAFCKN